MFTRFAQIPWYLWVLFPLIVIGLTRLIVWFIRNFELKSIGFPWNFEFEKRNKNAGSSLGVDANKSDLQRVYKASDETEIVRLEASSEELKNAEVEYLEKLRKNIFALLSRREVIDLTTKLEYPKPESIDAEFFLHSTRHNLNVWIYESINSPSATRNLHDVVKENDLLVILGEPGSGKSWSIYDIALKQIAKYQSGENRTIPLLVSANEWGVDQSPLDFLRQGLKKIIDSGLSNNRGELLLQRFEADLANGRYFVLIDAINEMPRRKISKIIFERDRKGRIPYSSEQSETLRAGFRNIVGDEREWRLNELVENTPETRYIVTCRTLDYEPRTLPWPQAQIQPLSDEQINKFINSRLSTSSGAIERMLKELGANKVAKALAGNPFYLEILIAVFQIKRELPRRRAELLRELVSLRLRETILKDSRVDSVAIEKCQNSLSRLALLMLHAGYAGSRAPISIVPNKDLPLIQIANRAGLVTIRMEANSDSSIAFYHELIQEYYAAAGLTIRISRTPISKLLRDQRWAEVIAMWIELEHEAKKRRKLFKRVLKGLNQKTGIHKTASLPWSIGFLIMLLAPALPCLLAGTIAELLTAPRIILPIFSANPLLSVALALFVPLLTARLWRSWSLDFQVRRNSAHILSSLPHPETAPDAVERMVELLNKNDVLRNTPLIDALVELGDFSRVRLRSALYTGKPHARYAAAIALGRLSDSVESKQISKIFVGEYPDLDTVNEKNWRAVLKTFWISYKSLMRVFLAGQAIQKSGEFLSEHLVKIWKESSNFIEKIASFFLLGMVQGRLPKSVSLGLTIDDTDPNSVLNGVFILSRVGDESSIKQILRLLHEGKIPDAGINQLMGINQITPSDAIPILIESLYDSHHLTRLITIRLLGLSKDISLEQHLLPLLDDADPEIRIAVIDALINIKSPNAANFLKEVTQIETIPSTDLRFKYFYMALYALATLGDDSIVDHLGRWLEKVDISDLDERDVIVVQIILLGFERLKSEKSLPWIERILFDPNQNIVVSEKALDILVAINKSACLYLIQRIPYCHENIIAIKIVESVKALGVLDLSLATSILNLYTSHEDEDVQKAARYALAKLSPESQEKALVSLIGKDHPLSERVQLSILHFTGLKMVDSMIRMYIKVIKKMSSFSPASFTFSANMTNQNPILNNMQYLQEYTQFNTDIFTNTTGLQKWGCSMFSFWLPIFLASIGLFYWMNMPIMALHDLALTAAWKILLFISIVIVFACLSSSRMAARIWGIPLIISLTIGIPLYRTIFNVFEIEKYPIQWIVFIALYVLSLVLAMRFQIEKYLPLNLILIIVFLPLLPIALPGVLTFLLLNYLYEKFQDKWWKPFLDGVLLGCGLFGVLVVMSILNWIPMWWSKVFWGIAALIVGASILWENIKSLHGLIYKISRITGYVFIVPAYLIKSWTEKVSKITQKGIDAGTRIALWWLVAGLYSVMLLRLGDQFAISTTTILKVLLLSIFLYSISDFILLKKIRFLQIVLFAPYYLVTLPVEIGIWLLSFLLKVVVPFLVRIIISIIRLLPWRFTKEVSDWLGNEDKLTAVTMVFSLGIGGYLAYDFIARLIQLSPNEFLLYLSPLLGIWIALLFLTIRAYRHEDYVAFSVLLLPVLLPLLPIITMFIATTITGFLFATLIQAHEKIPNPTSRQ